MKRLRTLKLSASEKALVFALPLLLLMLPLLASGLLANWCQILDPRTDSLQKTTYRLAGPGAVDCGDLTITDYIPVGFWDKTDGCAINAFQAGKAFRVRYDYSGMGIDSTYSEAWVQTSQKQVYKLSAQPPAFVVQTLIINPKVRTAFDQHREIQ
jgi:hypothetical protein